MARMTNAQLRSFVTGVFQYINKTNNTVVIGIDRPVLMFDIKRDSGRGASIPSVIRYRIKEPISSTRVEDRIKETATSKIVGFADVCDYISDLEKDVADVIIKDTRRGEKPVVSSDYRNGVDLGGLIMYPKVVVEEADHPDDDEYFIEFDYEVNPSIAMMVKDDSRY